MLRRLVIRLYGEIFRILKRNKTKELERIYEDIREFVRDVLDLNLNKIEIYPLLPSEKANGLFIPKDKIYVKLNENEILTLAHEVGEKIMEENWKWNEKFREVERSSNLKEYKEMKEIRQAWCDMFTYLFALRYFPHLAMQFLERKKGNSLFYFLVFYERCRNCSKTLKIGFEIKNRKELREFLRNK